MVAKHGVGKLAAGSGYAGVVRLLFSPKKVKPNRQEKGSGTVRW